MRATARRFIAPHIMAVILNDHPTEILSIMAWMLKEKSMPPTPDPADAMPIATVTFFENHCDKI
jgi:hypothetical protein